MLASVWSWDVGMVCGGVDIAAGDDCGTGMYRLLGVVVSRGRNLLPSPFRTEWDSGRFGWLKLSIGEVGRLTLKMNSG